MIVLKSLIIVMEKRLKKFVDQRTVVLAGISHDLRTPLTRMKLELEMMDSPSKSYLAEDIEYMESIINQYLNFTKNHEIKQTTHIINNSKNIQVFSNMDVWDTYKN